MWIPSLIWSCVNSKSKPSMSTYDIRPLIWPYNDFAGLSPKDKTYIEDTAEVLLADSPVILDVIHSAKKLKWAASTWAGTWITPCMRSISSTSSTFMVQSTLFIPTLNDKIRYDNLTVTKPLLKR